MRRRMHAAVRDQHRWLRQVLTGHYQYFGVIFNYRSLRVFKDCVVKEWRKLLGKRSQKGRMNWDLPPAHYHLPLPEPMIHQAWKGCAHDPHFRYESQAKPKMTWHYSFAKTPTRFNNINDLCQPS